MKPTHLLFLSLGLLLAGHGLQLSLLPLFAAEAGFDQQTIGLTGSFYFFGFVIGCLTATRLLQRAGAIRVLVVLMAVMAGVLLALEATPVAGVWVLLRFATGWAIAAIYATVEAWLAESAETTKLGRLFSTYVVVTLIGMAAGQLLLGFLPIDYLFTAGAVLMLIAVIPVGLFCPDHAMLLAPRKFQIGMLREIPAVATIGVGLTGIITGCIWTMAPLMGQSRGFSYADIALMMNVIILGGVLMQFPFGLLSDHWKRSATISLVCLIGFAASATGFIFRELQSLTFLLLMLCYGGCALSLYGICASEGQAATGLNRIETSSILLLIHGLGSVIGPLLAGLTASHADQSVFLVSAGAFALLTLVALTSRTSKSAEIIHLEPAVPWTSRQLDDAA